MWLGLSVYSLKQENRGYWQGTQHTICTRRTQHTTNLRNQKTCFRGFAESSPPNWFDEWGNNFVRTFFQPQDMRLYSPFIIRAWVYKSVWMGRSGVSVMEKPLSQDAGGLLAETTPGRSMPADQLGTSGSSL